MSSITGRTKHFLLQFPLAQRRNKQLPSPSGVIAELYYRMQTAFFIRFCWQRMYALVVSSGGGWIIVNFDAEFGVPEEAEKGAGIRLRDTICSVIALRKRNASRWIRCLELLVQEARDGRWIRCSKLFLQVAATMILKMFAWAQPNVTGQLVKTK